MENDVVGPRHVTHLDHHFRFNRKTSQTVAQVGEIRLGVRDK
jgi:hypothetical protein